MENSIYKEIWIKAPIEEVFACFTNEEAMLSWHGKEVTVDPRPGGIYKVMFENGDVIEGEYREVIPYEKVIYTSRYGTVDSEITIDFVSENEGTTVKLHQKFKPGQDTSSFNQGWDYFLNLLKERFE